MNTLPKIKHADAIRLFTFRYDPRAKKAIILEACGGKFARFRKGEVVFAMRRGRGSRNYIIERDRWRGAMMPLSHQCYGINPSCLSFI